MISRYSAKLKLAIKQKINSLAKRIEISSRTCDQNEEQALPPTGNPRQQAVQEPASEPVKANSDEPTPPSIKEQVRNCKFYQQLDKADSIRLTIHHIDHNPEYDRFDRNDFKAVLNRALEVSLDTEVFYICNRDIDFSLSAYAILNAKWNEGAQEWVMNHSREYEHRIQIYLSQVMAPTSCK